jgi:7-cyano-7-deazaguanine synthase
MTAPAVVLLSGGLDSTTVLAIAAEQGRAVHALSFAYGQRHEVEIACARVQADRFGAVAHETIDVSALGRLVVERSSLIEGSGLPVPKERELEHAAGIPSTYVPARNTLFLSYGLAWAEVVGAREIWLGVNAYDYSGYPDCRPEYLRAYEAMANLATRAAVEGEPLRVMAPLVNLRKHEIIARGLTLDVDYADTVSCYDPRGDDAGRPLACGSCDSCQLRRRGFELAGVPDPTRYVE